MRIAVLADVHGNLAALDAVLAHAAGRRVDRLVDLGDVASGPLWPAQTIDRVRALGHEVVRGNHDRQLLGEPATMGDTDRRAHAALDDDHRRWLSRLPTAVELPGGVLAVHGTPTDDRAYLLETVAPSGARAATDEELVSRLGDAAGRPLVLCGHSHLARAVRTSTGCLVVNPGSVGWPAYDDDAPFPHAMEAGSPHARYAIVDDGPAQWSVEHHAVAYDWDAAAARAAAAGRADIARQLRTGRA